MHARTAYCIIQSVSTVGYMTVLLCSTIGHMCICCVCSVCIVKTVIILFILFLQPFEEVCTVLDPYIEFLKVNEKSL